MKSLCSLTLLYPNRFLFCLSLTTCTQGRFIEATPQLIVANLISVIPSVQTPTGGLTINFDETTAKNVQSWGVRLFGHKLHQFGKPAKKELELDQKTIDTIKDIANKESPKDSELERGAPMFGMGLNGVDVKVDASKEKLRRS